MFALLRLISRASHSHVSHLPQSLCLSYCSSAICGLRQYEQSRTLVEFLVCSCIGWYYKSCNIKTSNYSNGPPMTNRREVCAFEEHAPCFITKHHESQSGADMAELDGKWLEFQIYHLSWGRGSSICAYRRLFVFREMSNWDDTWALTLYIVAQTVTTLDRYCNLRPCGADLGCLFVSESEKASSWVHTGLSDV